MLLKKKGGFARIPEGLCQNCPGCRKIIFTKELEKNLMVCGLCGFHYKLTAKQRIEQVSDPDTFQEINAHLVSRNPLGFDEYPPKLEKAVLTGLNDCMVTGTCQIDGIRTVLGVSDFRIIGGSMGSVCGEKIARAFELAINERLPVVFFAASGGARMHEGMFSLMQMPKTAAAAQRMIEQNLPYIVVYTNPTMAGVLASYASLGHYILAEPKATVGFAGQRVGHKDQSDGAENFQTSEFQSEHGMIDMIVSRKDMRSTLSLLLEVSGCQKGVSNVEG